MGSMVLDGSAGRRQAMAKMAMSASRVALFLEYDHSPSSDLYIFHLNRAGVIRGLIDVKFSKY